MATQIKKLLTKRYPQHYIVRKPFIGTLVFLIFVFLFVIIYRPFEIHDARSFGFYFTMLLYCTLISFPVLAIALLLNRTNCFSANKEWNVTKEFLSIIIILTIIGIAAYFAGFLIEEKGERWNFSTFFNSFTRALLIGAVPVFIPSLFNIRYLLTPDILYEFVINNHPPEKESKERLIQIESKAKKENLSFYPDQFIYAESKGNYVVFHLIIQDQPKGVMIRNSIIDIEQQLSEFGDFLRIHRAFIVNLNKVRSKEGNALGYRLKLAGSNDVIPVSRQNIRKFDEMTKYR